MTLYSDIMLQNSQGIDTKVVYATDYTTTADVIIGKGNNLTEAKGQKISVSDNGLLIYSNYDKDSIMQKNLSNSKIFRLLKDTHAAGGGAVNNHKVVFTIEDNGIGIKAENEANLFKKFYQIDTSATRKRWRYRTWTCNIKRHS